MAKAIVGLLVCLCILESQTAAGTSPNITHWLQICQMNGCSNFTSTQQMRQIQVGSQEFQIKQNGKDDIGNSIQVGHCFFLHGDGDRCTNDYKVTPKDGQGETTGKSPHLLLLQYGGKTKNGYQLNFANRKIESHMFPWAKLSAVVYLKTESKFLISQGRGVFKGAEKTPTLKRITWQYTHVECLSADEEENIVFLVADHDVNRPCNVFKMTLTGTNHKYLVNMGSHFSCLIVVDTKRKKFYFNTYRKLQQYDYRGFLEKQLFRITEDLYTFTYVPHLKAFFYMQSSKLMKLSNDTASNVLDLPPEEKGYRSMVFNSNTLYISSRGFVDYIFIIDLSGKGKGSVIKLPTTAVYLLSIM